MKLGVPCSKLKDYAEDAEIPCTSEEEVFAIAAGCILAGKKPSVYMQNSGFFRCLDILASLYIPYKIPYPNLILSVRSKPKHHEFLGKITFDTLKTFDYDLAGVIKDG